ncbi:hypothetical protein [Candidatus Methylacidiphilum fumarolicum]|uniref:hypothetical protein n=1 Tax=Candidatus Methylacidiphilum fumarolicum TaxID=591154 RepID=UPI0005D366BD
MHWSRCTAGRCRKHGAGAKAFELSTERFLTSARLEPGKSEPVVSEGTNPRHLCMTYKKLKKARENGLLQDGGGDRKARETEGISSIQEAAQGVRADHTKGRHDGECQEGFPAQAERRDGRDTADC